MTQWKKEGAQYLLQWMKFRKRKILPSIAAGPRLIVIGLRA